MSRPAFRRTTTGAAPSAFARSESAPVTGQPTSAFSQQQILQLMKAEFGRARRLGLPMACIAVRIEGFFAVAEKHGNEASERVRAALATLVRECIRDYDHLGMLGETGCLLVLPQTDERGAAAVADRIRRAFAGHDVALRPRPADLKLSLGVATTDVGDTLFFDTLLAQAEHARDRASDGGGDRVEVFSKDRFVLDS
ncbi:MAG: GGDEF domain-containing protein [Planctomycetota bacterium]